MPEQKGWAEIEPETPKQLPDLRLKKRRPGVFSFMKVAGNLPKRASWRPQSASHSGFLAGNFLGRDFTAQLIGLYFYLGRGSWSNGNAPIKTREKIQRAWTWLFLVPAGWFLLKMGPPRS
jgi:hypothetical protein